MVAPLTPPLNPPLSAPPAPVPARARAGPPAASPKPGRGRVVAFALVASGLLVAGVLAFSGMWPGHDASVQGADIEPEAYTADTVERVASLSSVTGVATSTGVVTGALPEGAEDEARAALSAAIAQALAVYEQALADAALPEVPADYTEGVVPTVTLPAPEGYLSASFADSLPVGPVTSALSGVGFTPQASPVGPRASSLPLADVLAQVEGALQQVQDVLGESVPINDVVPGLPPLPVAGGAPSQASGAQDAVEPDENGASLADSHATALLGATSGAYGTASSELTALLASYQKLATLTAQAIKDTQAIGSETSADIEARLQERLADIDAQARGLTAQATRLAGEQRKVADKAQVLAESTIQTALDDQLDAIDDARGLALANVTASVTSLQRQADSTKAEVQSLVDLAVVELSANGSPEAMAGIEAIRAAGVAAVLKIDRETTARVEAIEASRAGIEADAEAVQEELAEQAEAVIGGLDAVRADAVATATDAKAYLIAVAQAQAELAQEREVEMAADAVADVEALVDEHVDTLLATGLKATDAADGILATTSTLVQDVEDAASTQVGKDLEYIVKVSEDYGRVPTQERKERAQHWSSTAAEIDGLLDGTLAAGQSLELLAKRTVSAASQAQAQIEAMA